MKYIITENRLSKLVSLFLDKREWYRQDAKNDGFNISNTFNGEPVLRYRIRKTNKGPLQILYISENLAREIFAFFNLNQVNGLTAIVEWFNQNYDKNLTYSNTQWMQIFDEFDYDEYDEYEEYDDDDDEFYLDYYDEY